MGKYSDLFFSGGSAASPSEAEKPKAATAATPGKYSSLFFGSDAGGVRREFSPDPSGEIDTRTSKPKLVWTPILEPSTGFGTLVQSGFVDDPRKKIEIFAKGRGISPSRYRVTPDGEIVYRGDDGNEYPETPGTLPSIAKKFAGETVAHSPGIVMGTIGAAGGPVAASIGAAGGEAIRKRVGAEVYGEEQTRGGNAFDLFVEGLLAGAGERAGRLLIGTGNMAASKAAGPIRMGMRTELKYNLIQPEDHARAEAIEALSNKLGVRLAPHQIYNKQGMATTWKYLRQHPITADMVQEFEDQLAGDVDKALLNFTNKLSSSDDPFLVGSRLQKTAQGAIDTAKTKRTEAVRPLYEKAFDGAPDVDVAPILDRITEMETGLPRGSSTLKAVQRVKTMLTTKGDKKGAVDPVTDLEILDNVKKELDTMIGSPSTDWKTSIEKSAKGRLTEIGKDLRGTLEKASPEYAEAKALYKDLSPAIEELENGIIGNLAKVKSEEQMTGLVDKVFRLKSPRLVAKIRDTVKAGENGEQLWNDVAGMHIRNVWENLSETEGGNLINVAGKMRKKLFGTARQRETWKQILEPQQYQNLDDMMTIFQRAAFGTGKESMTAQFQETGKLIGQLPVSKIYGAVSAPRQAATDFVFGKWNDMIVAGRQRELVDAMLDPKATQMIRHIKTLDPGGDRYVRQVATFTAMMAAGAFRAQKGTGKAGTLRETREPGASLLQFPGGG